MPVFGMFTLLTQVVDLCYLVGLCGLVSCLLLLYLFGCVDA